MINCLGVWDLEPLFFDSKSSSEIFYNNTLGNFTLATLGKEGSVLGEVTADLCMFSAF